MSEQPLIGIEPEWNHFFEVDGISYDRYVDNTHQGQQMICDIKPDFHVEAFCSLCSPDKPLMTEPPDSYRWRPDSAAEWERKHGEKLVT